MCMYIIYYTYGEREIERYCFWNRYEENNMKPLSRNRGLHLLKEPLQLYPYIQASTTLQRDLRHRRFSISRRPSPSSRRPRRP